MSINFDFPPGIEIVYSVLDAELDGATQRGVLWQAGKDCFQIDIPEVGRFRVENGRRITIQPDPGVDEPQLSQMIRMTPLAALLYQRGMLAFHASVAAPPANEDFPQAAIVLAGDSGAGKSSLAAALAQQGWSLLSDDLGILGQEENGTVTVWPLKGPLALWPHSLLQLGITGENNKAEVNRRVWVDYSPSFSARPLLLQHVFRLSVSNQGKAELHPIPNRVRFATIGSLTYNSHIAAALVDRAGYLSLAAQVARSCSFWKLNRPRGKWSIPDLIELIANILRMPTE